MSKHRPIHVNDRTSIVEIDGLTYIVDPTATPHEATEWLHKHYRTRAFAAIRRAAEVAREYDRIYREAFASCDCSTYSVTPDGDDVRRAIRAAIGSEKA